MSVLVGRGVSQKVTKGDGGRDGLLPSSDVIIENNPFLINNFNFYCKVVQDGLLTRGLIISLTLPVFCFSEVFIFF